MSNGLNWDTRQRIDALVSVNKRLMGEKADLTERVAVLENLVQSVSDDRDGYMERAVELEDERDRARNTAVAFEQQIGRIESRVTEMQREYTIAHCQNPSPSTAAAVDVLSAVEAVLSYVTDIVLADLIEEDEAAA